jgi:chorismate synthase
MYNSFGHIFRITTFGESHGVGIGVVIDGIPSGVRIDLDDIQAALHRRRPGQSDITTPRKESDRVELISGLYQGVTTGAPLTLLIRNQDAKPDDYQQMETVFRPSHADFTYLHKYGIKDHRGSGRASARETAARVAAGAIAKQVLIAKSQIEVLAWVQAIGDIEMPTMDGISSQLIDNNDVRCPHAETASRMRQLIIEMQASGDSVGGVIACHALGLPIGLGQPVYAKLNAMLASAMFSLPAVKGFELGSGFAGTRMKGSMHNDAFYKDAHGVIHTRTNHSGGIQGGISNGEPITFKVGFKPVSTIAQSQSTVDTQGAEVSLAARGRHDPCVLPRAVPIVEAMTWIVLADAWLMHRNSNWASTSTSE